jgi:uncharacterized protein (DUF58 family)
MSALLSSDLLRRLEQLQLLAARRAKSTVRGERQSRARGQSVEFADYRNYVAGDDFRYLDWNLFGRLDRLFLKLYEEERELPVRIFLDASESMTFGTPPKFDVARQLAAAVGYVALCGFDRVSMTAFPDVTARAAAAGTEASTRAALRQVRGRASSVRFLRDLEQLTAGGAADFNQTLRRSASEARHVGIAVVISDFLDPAGYDAGLKALVSRGFAVSVIQVLAPEEVDPSTFGDLRLIDSETGAEQEVTFGKFRLKAYRRTVQRFCDELRAFCRNRGISFSRIVSNTPVEQFLLKELRASRIWG